MSKSRTGAAEVPPCYAMVHPGLEPVAAEEVVAELGAAVRKTVSGLVVFRPLAVSPDLLGLRCAEDVFLLAWGTDSLTFRAADLKSIRHWTAAEPDWDRLLALHHATHPRPRGRPTYRLVAQMAGPHAYRRVDALEAMAKGLAGKFPGSWKPAEEDAAVEVWLTVRGKVAVCGVRLSDRAMRHREYKSEHLPASLRPTVAAAMVRLADARPGQRVIDPTCGAGTILAEQLDAARRSAGRIDIWGGDIDTNALHAARGNLSRLGPVRLHRWDAARLPLGASQVDRVVANPPFGKQLASPAEVGPLYRRLVREANRVLKPGGRAVLLVSDVAALRAAVKPTAWVPARQVKLRVLGQEATAAVWNKPV